MKIAIPIGGDHGRGRRRRPQPSGTPSAREIRTSVAIVTAATHAAVSSSIHQTFVSVPVPRPWSTATGQLA